VSVGLTNLRAGPDNCNAITTGSQSGFSSPNPGTPSGGAPVRTGRLILIWYAGFVLAALLAHCAMDPAQSVALSSALLAGAVVVPLTLLGYTLRTYGANFNSHVVVPALGPIVIAVLIFEYVEYNRRIDDAFSAQLIPANLIQLSDVKWTSAVPGQGGRLSGRVLNRSPHQLVGMNLEIRLYAGREQLASVDADAALDVPPGQQRSFTTGELQAGAGHSGVLPCADAAAAKQKSSRENEPPQVFECVYSVMGTRGEQVFF
jgi:hypothetical protein